MIIRKRYRIKILVMGTFIRSFVMNIPGYHLCEKSQQYFFIEELNIDKYYTHEK